MPYFLAGRSYRNSDEVRAACRLILMRTPTGEGLEGADAELAEALFDLHPLRSIKAGAGVLRHEVIRAPVGARRCFGVRRVDGSIVDWSIERCLNRKAGHSSMVMAAMRQTIRPFTEAFRQGQDDGSGCAVCAVTWEVDDLRRMHVDHAAPLTFARLAAAFVVETHGGWESVEVLGHDELSGPRLRPDVDLAWYRYHAERAVLRVVTRRVNLSILRRSA